MPEPMSDALYPSVTPSRPEAAAETAMPAVGGARRGVRYDLA